MFFCYPSPIPPWLRTSPCLCSFAGLAALSVTLCTVCGAIRPKSEFGQSVAKNPMDSKKNKIKNCLIVQAVPYAYSLLSGFLM